MSKPFKGTAQKCLLHYAEHTWPPAGTKNLTEFKRPMARFVGVVPHTITSWLSGTVMPVGLPLFKLRFFLQAVGYDVEELRHYRDKTSYMLAEMLAYDIVVKKDLVTALGFIDEHSVYRLAHGQSSTTSDRAEKIEKMYKENSELLALARSELLASIAQAPQIVAETPVATSKPERQLSQVGEDSDLVSLGYLVLAITPLLERVVVNGTREQRSRLRELTGDDGMFRLSKASSKLCSEKALEVLNGK